MIKKITVEISGKEYEMTVDEATQMYEALKTMFDTQIITIREPATPVIPQDIRPDNPYYPPPVWYWDCAYQKFNWSEAGIHGAMQYAADEVRCQVRSLVDTDEEQ